MKTSVLRDNTRKVKVPSNRGNHPRSQSPPQNKLLKKIEGIQTNSTQMKHDHSLQENILHTEQQEEAEDFRVEIERRFRKSSINREFRFPLHTNNLSHSYSSQESSLDSLKYVTVYDLASQNIAKKSNRSIQRMQTYTTSDYRDQYEPTKETDESHLHDYEDYIYEQPLETLICDKSSAAYQNLIKLLESQRMFSHNSTNLHTQEDVRPKANVEKHQTVSTQHKAKEFLIPQPEVARNKVVSSQQSNRPSSSGRSRPKQNGNISAGTNGRNSAKKNRLSSSREGLRKTGQFDNSSTTRNETHPLSTSHERHTTIGTGGSRLKERPSSSLKKTFSHDKMLSALQDKSPGNQSASRDSYSKAKQNQEALKKIYNSNILKSITPQYQTSKQESRQLFSREGMFKTYDGSLGRTQAAFASNTSATPSGVGNGKSPYAALSSLYQKAQKDVITHKFSRISDEQHHGPILGQPQHKKAHSHHGNNHSHSNTSSSMLPTSKRDETPKGVSRRMNTEGSELSGYFSPEQILEKYSAINRPSSRSKQAQKDMMKALHIRTPGASANEKIFYMSYDLSHPAQTMKKSNTKRESEYRNQSHSRETLSSKRTRQKTPNHSEKHALSRTALEQNITNHMLNGSLYKDSSKESLIGALTMKYRR